MTRFGRAGQWRRIAAVLLTVAWGPSCQAWHTEAVPPAQLLAARHTAKLRITRSDRSQVVLEQPTLQGDTILGIAGNHRFTSVVRVPLADVREVAILHVSAWRTVALVTGVAAVALTAAAVVFAIQCAETDCFN